MNKYLEFWNITEPVFMRPFAPADFYQTTRVKEIQEKLDVFLSCGQNLVLVQGGSGTGKTSLATLLYHSLPQDTCEVFFLSLLNEETASGWLIPKLHDFVCSDSPSVSFEQNQLARDTISRLDIILEEKRRLVILIDAAEKIKSPEAFADISALYHIFSASLLDFSLVLFGHHRIMDLLKKIPELSSRISHFAELSPLNKMETLEYLHYRFSLAKIAMPFDEVATQYIIDNCHGLFSTIGVFVENCLIEASHNQNKKIDFHLAREALKSLIDNQFESLKFKSPDSVNLPHFPSEREIPEKIRSSSAAGQKKNEGKDGTTSIQLGSLFKEETSS